MGRDDLHIAKECVYQFAVTFGLQKNSFLTKSFNDVVMRLIEAGIIQEIYKKEMDEHKEGIKVLEEQNEEVKLTIEHLQAPFIFLIMAYVICFLGFFFEIIYHKGLTVVTSFHREGSRNF